MRSIALRPSWHRGSPVMGEKRHVGPKQIGLFDGSVCGVYISAMGQLATNAVQQIASYSITSSARAGVLPDRMSTPRRPDAGVPQRPRPAPDAHASLLKLPPPQIIFCAATPAPGLRPLVWVNAP